MPPSDEPLRVTSWHRQLFTRMTPEDRRWVARRLSPTFPPHRVSVLALASLRSSYLALLEQRVRERDRERREANGFV